MATRLPAQDLDRARAFSAEKLGLELAEERPGGLLYHCANGTFALFESTGAPSGSHTQMAWGVDDIEAMVAELRSRGVVFAEVDLPGRTAGGITTVSGTYPSKGTGERAARPAATGVASCSTELRSPTTRPDRGSSGGNCQPRRFERGSSDRDTFVSSSG
ncbi:VOC family protein [Pseudonocardia bannensis]|uniref:VOC family protein n=1 Tax=Pseudonocardia bannensis TaxID=630973 RepID=UPI001FEC8DDA|nr:VOC family protein [Pseudonocardia bannensis]